MEIATHRSGANFLTKVGRNFSKGNNWLKNCGDGPSGYGGCGTPFSLFWH